MTTSAIQGSTSNTSLKGIQTYFDPARVDNDDFYFLTDLNYKNYKYTKKGPPFELIKPASKKPRLIDKQKTTLEECYEQLFLQTKPDFVDQLQAYKSNLGKGTDFKASDQQNWVSPRRSSATGYGKNGKSSSTKDVWPPKLPKEEPPFINMNSSVSRELILEELNLAEERRRVQPKTAEASSRIKRRTLSTGKNNFSNAGMAHDPLMTRTGGFVMMKYINKGNNVNRSSLQTKGVTIMSNNNKALMGEFQELADLTVEHEKQVAQTGETLIGQSAKYVIGDRQGLLLKNNFIGQGRITGVNNNRESVFGRPGGNQNIIAGFEDSLSETEFFPIQVNESKVGVNVSGYAGELENESFWNKDFKCLPRLQYKDGSKFLPKIFHILALL
jgi:hypothetical protein